MATEKIFALRFDIDTPKCLREGVPPLIDLAERLNIRFTFFLNVGRSISVPNFLRMKLSGRPADIEVAASLSAREKLGIKDYLHTALINPRIGPAYASIVDRLAASQELGLHGGKNHDLWHHLVHTWTAEQLMGEVSWATHWLKSKGHQVMGFSAPGWSVHPELAGTLKSLGFSYRADRHGSRETWGISENGLINVGTNFTGEPGGVAYIEHHRALGHNDDQILSDFEERLQKSGGYAVMYDHPYFVGVREIPLLTRLLEKVRVRGFRIITLSEIAEMSRERIA